MFRKTVATRLDEAGLSARQIADHLGHNRPSLTQDVYMGRGLASPEAATALQRSALSFDANDHRSRQHGGRRDELLVVIVRRATTRLTDFKPLTWGFAPPIGLEPITLRLTVACSAN